MSNLKSNPALRYSLAPFPYTSSGCVRALRVEANLLNCDSHSRMSTAAVTASALACFTSGPEPARARCATCQLCHRCTLPGRCHCTRRHHCHSTRRCCHYHHRQYRREEIVVTTRRAWGAPPNTNSLALVQRAAHKWRQHRAIQAARRSSSPSHRVSTSAAAYPAPPAPAIAAQPWQHYQRRRTRSPRVRRRHCTPTPLCDYAHGRRSAGRLTDAEIVLAGAWHDRPLRVPPAPHGPRK